MGYCMSQDDSDFYIDADKKADALKAIKEQLMTKVDTLGNGGCFSGDKEERWFSWVDTTAVLSAETLESALFAWRWNASVDEHGNIVGICFEGEKLGDDQYLWDTIAPFVKDNSYIEMTGEDNYHWKWKFKLGECDELEGKIVYPGE